MIQRSQHFRFALKTGKPLGVVCECFRQNFDGYVAPKLRVMRLIHFSHSTRTNGGEDFVRAEFGATGDGHLFTATLNPLTAIISCKVRGLAFSPETVHQLARRRQILDDLNAEPSI